jgi:micrococcal nuclease
MKLFPILAAALTLAVSPLAHAQTRTPPKTFTYQGTITSVYDADTMTAHIEGWPAPFNPIGVRIDGIDTPESRLPPAKSKCEVVRGKAGARYAKRLIPVGTKVTIIWTEGHHDKYRRLLAKVILPDGRSVADVMIQQRHARPYDGGTKQKWC